MDCSISVNPGDVLNIYVGEQGSISCYHPDYLWNFDEGGCRQSSGGWNRGGDIFLSTYAYEYDGSPNGPGWGGGASDIRLNGTSLSDRIVVAGGGGGQSNDNNGGHGIDA